MNALQTRSMTLALTLATLALGACKKGSEDARAATAPAVQTVGPENIAVATRTQLRTGPAISGSLAAEQEATLRAEVPSTVLQTYVEEGQRVARGTLLARLDDTGLRDQQLSARSAVTSAQTAAETAERSLERARKLLAAGAVAPADVEAAERAATAANSGLADARARLVNAQKQLEKTRIVAPFDGIVATRAVNAGDAVQPGAAIMTVVDPSSMRLEASVPAEELAGLKINAPVEFTVAGYPNRTFTGHVSRINPVADPTTRQVRIYATIPNTGRTLVAGLFAEGRVATDAHDAIVVPSSAVNVRGLSPTVMRIKNGKAQRAEVAVGVQDAATERVEIRSGLVAGDTVLLGAAQAVNPGTQIQVAVVRDKP